MTAVADDDVCELLCLDLPHAEGIRAALPDSVRLEAVAGSARALGDQTRLRIAAALGAGDELWGGGMAWVVGGSQGLVSHHLRQLRAGGIVTSRKDGRMVMYRLSPRGCALLSVLFDRERVPYGAEHG